MGSPGNNTNPEDAASPGSAPGLSAPLLSPPGLPPVPDDSMDSPPGPFLLPPVAPLP